ncbi:MAG TPA: F0F1 ATP synthase subunit B [Stellaceae bacterium]|nr:F0F1 ATP synthase subunit B [Stellaceae bacterium]
MDEALHNPETWVAVAFVIAVALMWWKGAGHVTAMLDARAAGIRADLEEAKRLRDEAQATLEDFKRRQAEALGTARDIAERAKMEAERLAADTRRDMEAAIRRREELAHDRIAQAEAAAVAEVRGVAVEVAIGAARRVIVESLDAQRGARLIDDAIGALPSSLH